MKYTFELTNEMLDKIVMHELTLSRNNFINSLDNHDHVFVWNDQEADNVEIQKHIDALDVIIRWYATAEQLEDIYGKSSS